MIWPSNPTRGCIYEENHNLKQYVDPNIHCSAVYNSQDMKTI